MKYRLCVNIILVFSSFAFSQKQAFLYDWAQIMDLYNCTDNKQIEADYYMYESQESKKVYSTSHSIVKSKNDKLYQNIGDIITLMDSDYMVLVDHSESTILLDRSPRDYFNVISQINFDTSLQSIIKIEVLHSSYSTKKYRIYINNPEYEKMEFTFNKQTMHLIDISLFYSKEIALNEEKPDELSKPKLVIKYKPMIKVQEPFYTINANPYFSFDGKQIQAKNTCKKYQCIDNRVRFK